MGNRQPIDPRITRTREVVLAAVLEELAAVGNGGFTIESVAQRCGVGKSTIYRHWEGKTDLVMDAMRTLNTQPAPTAAGTPHERIRQLLAHLAAVTASGAVGAALPALIEAAARDAALRAALDDYSGRRRAALIEAVADGVADGSIAPSVDPDLAAQALAGAIFYARLMTATPLDAAVIDALITTVVGAPRG